jgi:phosphohistidine phosphatase
MLRLMLLRHAKAEWPQEVATGDDYERPLSPRGELAAPRMGQYLKENLLLPDLIITSTAVRAQKTYHLLAPFLDAPCSNEPRLYMASPETMIEVISEAAPDVRTLLIVGHNPALGELAMSFVGSGDRYAFARLKSGVPTASLTVLDFDVEHWTELTAHSARLDRFVCPNDLEMSA